MSHSNDGFDEFESVNGSGAFARVVEAIEPQNNSATEHVLRFLAHAAELGERPEEYVSELVANVAGAVLQQENPLESHSLSHEQDIGIGGTVLPFLPGWRLYIDLYAPDNTWPISSLEPVEKVDFMLYPQINDGESKTDDLLCNFGPSAVFTRNISNRWAYDALNSSLELQSQVEVLEFLAGLEEGIAASK